MCVVCGVKHTECPQVVEGEQASLMVSLRYSFDNPLPGNPTCCPNASGSKDFKKCSKPGYRAFWALHHSETDEKKHIPGTQKPCPHDSSCKPLKISLISKPEKSHSETLELSVQTLLKEVGHLVAIIVGN